MSNFKDTQSLYKEYLQRRRNLSKPIIPYKISIILQHKNIPEYNGIPAEIPQAVNKMSNNCFQIIIKT